MGFRSILMRIWRFLRPQWKAMTDREIEELDRAVAASMAAGTFGLRQPDATTTTGNMTGDRLWSLGSQQTRASRVSEASSRAYGSGYGGRPVSAAARQQQQQQQHQKSRWEEGPPGQRPGQGEGVPGCVGGDAQV